MTKILAIATGLSIAAAGVLGWLLLGAHEDLGKARLAAELNAKTIAVLEAQEARNQQIDQRLEQLQQARATHTKEIVREIYQQESTDACRKSPPMRALDGRLRWQPGHPDDRQPAPAAPAQPLPPAR